MVETNTTPRNVEKSVSIQSIEQILPTPAASPCKPAQNDDDEDEINVKIEPEPASTYTPEKRTSRRRVAATSIDYSAAIQPKRPRGRPPKTEPTHISPAEFRRLTNYDQMRMKNNEASRRSRLSRKSKEDALVDELTALEQHHEHLKLMDIQLDSEQAKWRKKLIKLCQIEVTRQ